jgi:hypothetical protein
MKRSDYDTADMTPEQIAALDYIKNNNVKILMSEMLNSLVVSNSEEPLVYMVRIYIKTFRLDIWPVSLTSRQWRLKKLS